MGWAAIEVGGEGLAEETLGAVGVGRHQLRGLGVEAFGAGGVAGRDALGFVGPAAGCRVAGGEQRQQDADDAGSHSGPSRTVIVSRVTSTRRGRSPPTVSVG